MMAISGKGRRTGLPFPAPPQGFNPATASTADLQRYGFPLPPDRTKYPTEYQQWLQVMSHATHRVVQTFTPQPGVTHGTSLNWSSAVALTSTGYWAWCVTESPDNVWGQWTVPGVASSTHDNVLTFWLENLTTGQYAVFRVTAKYGCRYGSAEWITERPTVNGSYTPLADFGHTHMSDAYYQTVLGYTYPAITSGFNPLTINMVNGSGTALAYGYAPAVDQVDSLWINYS
jgi:hypothetical protein